MSVGASQALYNFAWNLGKPGAQAAPGTIEKAGRARTLNAPEGGVDPAPETPGEVAEARVAFRGEQRARNVKTPAQAVRGATTKITASVPAETKLENHAAKTQDTPIVIGKKDKRMVDALGRPIRVNGRIVNADNVTVDLLARALENPNAVLARAEAKLRAAKRAASIAIRDRPAMLSYLTQVGVRHNSEQNLNALNSAGRLPGTENAAELAMDKVAAEASAAGGATLTDAAAVADQSAVSIQARKDQEVISSIFQS